MSTMICKGGKNVCRNLTQGGEAPHLMFIFFFKVFPLQQYYKLYKTDTC